MAKAAKQAQQEAQKMHAQNEVTAAMVAERERQQREAEMAEQRRLEEQRRAQERERRRQEEEERQRLEEEVKREERRRVRAEERRKRKEEKQKYREQTRREEERDDCSSDEEEEAQRRPVPSTEAKAGRLVREAFRGDGGDAKRLHWGYSVKGKVSNDYRGFSDADLDRRFNQQMAASSSREKLMTEAEVLSMLKKGRK